MPRAVPPPALQPQQKGKQMLSRTTVADLMDMWERDPKYVTEWVHLQEVAGVDGIDFSRTNTTISNVRQVDRTLLMGQTHDEGLYLVDLKIHAPGYPTTFFVQLLLPGDYSIGIEEN